MALRPILIPPHALLKAKAKPVTEVDARVRQLMDDLLETMYAAPGIGLAANQIGVLERVIVLDVARDNEPPQPLRLANPQFVWQSEELSTHNEGCLSVPDHYADVTRPAECKVRYLNENNERKEVHATGLLATCLQHEMEHLDGILFFDHLSALKRNIILRKLVKQQKAQAEAAM